MKYYEIDKFKGVDAKFDEYMNSYYGNSYTLYSENSSLSSKLGIKQSPETKGCHTTFIISEYGYPICILSTKKDKLVKCSIFEKTDPLYENMYAKLKAFITYYKEEKPSLVVYLLNNKSEIVKAGMALLFGVVITYAILILINNL